MKKHFSTLKDSVVDQGLCTRCGTCGGVCPTEAITFNDDCFPTLSGKCVSCGFCFDCCPGGDVNLPEITEEMFGESYDFNNLEGTVENTFVCHPVDDSVRFAGASGGLVTGLLLYLLETKKINGAVIVGADPDHPYRTKGILATTSEEIRAGAQSKYCVTPSMEVLSKIRKKEGQFAIVALPCQIQGLRKLRKVDPKLAKKIYAVFGLYCACTMNPNGHLEAMKAVGVKKEDVDRFDFRGGGGWPGGMHVTKKDMSKVPIHTSETFGTVINVMFRLFGAKRCYLCVDGLAEYADLSFGDFWAFDYPDEFSKLERCTLVSQRTKRGLEILTEAEKDQSIVSYLLPSERHSKRILDMATGKRGRSAFFMADREKKGLKNPNYHLSIPRPTSKQKKKMLTYRLFGFFRGKIGRTIILKILFSPLTSSLHKFNRFRQRVLSGYHGN